MDPETGTRAPETLFYGSEGRLRPHPYETHWLTQTAQRRALPGQRSIGQRLTRLGIGQHRLGYDHLAAAALMFEPRCRVHHRTEIVEHVAGSDGDAGAEMQPKLQDDTGVASVAIEVCHLVLNRQHRPHRIGWVGKRGHDRVTHGLDY